MKICYLADASIIHGRRWAGWFAAQGHEVLFVSTTGSCPAIPGVKIDYLVGKRDLPVIKWFFWSLHFSRIIRQWKPDILHVHQVTGAGWIGAATRFHPFIVTSWGSDLLQFPQRSSIHRWLTRQVIRRADCLTANSEHLAHVASQYGADLAKIKIVQWEVDRKLFFPLEETAAVPPAAPITLLSLRACTPIYNQHIILEAFSAVHKEIPATRLIFQDYSSHPAYKASLEEQVSRRAITDAVNWVGPAVSEDEIGERIRSAEIGISVPSSDSAPVSLLEALACGIPVIASDLPAVRELIVDRENGLLVPPGNAMALADAMLGLIQDPARRRQLREAALRRIEARPGRDAEMSKLEVLYQSLITKRKARQ